MGIKPHLSLQASVKKGSCGGKMTVNLMFLALGDYFEQCCV